MNIDLKLVVVFLVALFTLLYLITFRQNSEEKVQFHFLGQKMEINLGLLLFGVFIDGAILGFLLYWIFA